MVVEYIRRPPGYVRKAHRASSVCQAERVEGNEASTVHLDWRRSLEELGNNVFKGEGGPGAVFVKAPERLVRIASLIT